MTQYFQHLVKLGSPKGNIGLGDTDVLPFSMGGGFPWSSIYDYGFASINGFTADNTNSKRIRVVTEGFSGTVTILDTNTDLGPAGSTNFYLNITGHPGSLLKLELVVIEPTSPVGVIFLYTKYSRTYPTKIILTGETTDDIVITHADAYRLNVDMPELVTIP